MSHHVESQPVPESTRRLRAWLVRFGVVFACLCILLVAEYVRRAQVQRTAAVRLERMEVHLFYGDFDDKGDPKHPDREMWLDEWIGHEWLRTARAMNAEFSSRIDDRAFDEICKFPRVKCLMLTRARLSSASFEKLGRLKELVVLELDATNFGDDDLRHLRNLRRIRRLGLAYSAVTDAGIDELDKLQSLEVLNLRETRITAAGCSRLQSALPNTTITWSEAPSVDHWRACVKIKQAGGAIWSGPIWNDRTQNGICVSIASESHPQSGQPEWRGTNEDLSLLRDIRNFTKLNIESDLLGPNKWSLLAACSDLKELDFNCGMITDDALSHMQELPQLSHLSVNRSPITDAGIVHFHKTMNLKSLNLGRTGVTDAGLISLGNLTSLERLNLSYTPIGDNGMISLAELINLKHLYLSNTSVGDACLAHLGRLTKLEILSLDQTRVTDSGLEHLVGLIQLKFLNLRQVPNVSPAGVNRLKAAIPGLRVSHSQ